MIRPSPQENCIERPPLKRAEAKPFVSKNKRFQSEKGHDLWLLTLSDLLLLLVIFFVLLFGMTLRQQPQGSPSPSPQPGLTKSEGMAKPEETPVEIQPTVVQNSVPQKILASLEADLRAMLSDEGRGEGVSVTRQADRLVLTFPERILFDPARAQLSSSVQPVLDRIAFLASMHPYLFVEIQGHTDDRPINTKRYPSNWELSVDRATQVAKALIRLGLNPGQVTVKGFGEYRALCPNDSGSNRQKNRRVEIQFFLVPES